VNIFIVEENPADAAQALCDRHVTKMLLETAQLLCAPFPQGEAPYKRTHYNHPASVWTRANVANYFWVLQHGKALCREFEHRREKRHKSADVVDWCFSAAISLNLPQQSVPDYPALCMPDEYKQDNAIASYRAYYKAKLQEWSTRDRPLVAKWTNRQPPKWLK